MDEIKEYVEFRDLLINGNLQILKDELLHVLYKMWLKVIWRFLGKLAQERNSNELSVKIPLKRFPSKNS